MGGLIFFIEKYLQSLLYKLLRGFFFKKDISPQVPPFPFNIHFSPLITKISPPFFISPFFPPYYLYYIILIPPKRWFSYIILLLLIKMLDDFKIILKDLSI